MMRGFVIVLLLAGLLLACDSADPQQAAAERAARIAAAEADPVYRQRSREFQVAFQGGDHRTALAQAKLALEAAPVLREPYVWVSSLCTQMGRNQEAIRLFRETIEREPELALPWFYKGFNEYHLSMFEDALASFQRASELDPNDAQSWFRQGLIHYVQSNFEDAGVAFEKAYAADPAHELTAAHWVDVLRIEGEEAQAATLVEEALERLPNSAELLFRHGLIKLQAGEDAAAETSFRTAIERDPELREPHEHLARLLARTGRDDEAQLERDISERLNDYEKTRKTLEARQTDARDGTIAMLLAEVELSAGHPQIAARWFQRASQLGGHVERRAAGHAEALFLSGRADAATSLLERADATSSRYQLALVARHLEAGENDAALEALDRALATAPFERQLLRRASDYADRLGDAGRRAQLLREAVSAKTLSSAPDDEVVRD